MMFPYQMVHLAELDLQSLKKFESSPMKAMSKVSSSLARQGKYGRRPKVEIPEKTESACPFVRPACSLRL
jgi:hypothetical protein